MGSGSGSGLDTARWMRVVGAAVAFGSALLVVSVVVLLVVSVDVNAEEDEEDARVPHSSATELLGRAFANLHAEDYIQTMELSTQPRSGRGMTRLIQIIRKQSVVGRALIRFLEPYAVRRTSVLILENNERTDDLYV